MTHDTGRVLKLRTGPHLLMEIRLVDDLRVVEPGVALVFAAVCLEPGLAVEVADHPAGVHQEAGSC